MDLRAKAYDRLTVEPPAVPHSDVARLLERAYGLEGTLTPLPGERDQNVRVDAGKRYVLKIAPADDDPNVIALQTAALRHIAQADPELPVPRVRPTLSGGDVARLAVGPSQHVVRLLTFLDGEPLIATRASSAQRRMVGALAARVDLALKGFDHPAADHPIIWSLEHTREVEDLLEALDASQRALVRAFLERYGREVAPGLRRLRTQVIHGDINPNNVLVDPHEPERLAGLIDFGDIVRAPLVQNVAVAAARQIYTAADPIEAVADVVGAYHASLPLQAAEIGLLPTLIGLRLATRMTVATWRRQRTPATAHYDSAADALMWDALARLHRLDAEVMVARLRQTCTPNDARAAPTDSDASRSLVARRERVLGPSLRQFYRVPFHPVRASGCTLFDEAGRKFLDAYNNVAHVGHGHPLVVEAMARQAATLNTNTRYLDETIVRYGERLAARLPDALSVCLFVCSGTEANDLAFRLARAATGRTGALVFENAYHGNSATISRLDLANLPAERHEPWVATLPLPAAPDFGPDRVDEAVARLAAAGHAPAAFFFDSIFSSNGILAPDPVAMGAVVARVRAAGALVVADEVQAGFGRLGTAMWGFETMGLEPDIVTLGKPMANGHPVGATVARREIVESFAAHERYFNTFGGNPVAAAAGLATLDVLEGEGLQAHAKGVGEHLRQGLGTLARETEGLGAVSGSGLFLGVGLGAVDGRTIDGQALIDELCRRGILAGLAGPRRNVLKIRPPMVFSHADADRLTETLAAILADPATRLA